MPFQTAHAPFLLPTKHKALLWVKITKAQKRNKKKCLKSEILKKFTEIITNLSHIFLYQFWSNYSDKTSISPVGHSPGTQCFPCSRRTKQENPFGRFNTKINKSFGLKKDTKSISSYKNINGKWRVNCFTWVQQPVQVLVPLNSSERSQPCCFVYTNILLMSWNIIYLYFHVIMLFTVVTSYQDIAPEGFAC